jgi:DNA repair photolyase
MDIYNNEGKSDVIFRDYKCKEALYYLKRKGLPYSFDLNIYRGCSHNCQYCYARKSHKYLNSKDFESEIFVKTNVAEVLEKELNGGVCDSYQPAEKKFKLMPDILKLLIKYKQPVIISTKSDLILRDIELIDQLAHHAWVNIAVTITSDNDEVSSKVEPGASLPEVRWNILQDFSKRKASTGFHFFPILPFLSDDKTSMEKMVKRAS